MLFLFANVYVAATTHDYNVFSFHPDNSPCHGFEEVLACYRNVVPHLRLSGDVPDHPPSIRHKLCKSSCVDE